MPLIAMPLRGIDIVPDGCENVWQTNTHHADTHDISRQDE